MGQKPPGLSRQSRQTIIQGQFDGTSLSDEVTDGGSSTCVLGRFQKSKPHPVPRISSPGLTDRSERPVLLIFGGVKNTCHPEQLIVQGNGWGDEDTVRISTYDTAADACESEDLPPR